MMNDVELVLRWLGLELKRGGGFEKAEGVDGLDDGRREDGKEEI